MASRRPTHSGSAQTKELDIDLLAAGVHHASDPEVAEAVVSVDATSTLRVEISAPDRADWQLNARIAGSSPDYDEWAHKLFHGHRPADPIERAGQFFYLRYTQ